MRILLVRHGASVHAERGLMTSDTACPGLTEFGRAQAAALRNRFLAEGVETAALWSSTAARARETAEILAPGVGSPPVRPTQDLCELLLGEGEGLTYAEFVDRFGDPDAGERDVPICPGAESWRAYERRVDHTLPALGRSLDEVSGPGDTGHAGGVGGPTEAAETPATLTDPATIGGREVGTGTGAGRGSAPGAPGAPGTGGTTSTGGTAGIAGAGAGSRAAHGPVIAVTHAGFVVTSFLRNFAVPRPNTHARVDPDHASITEWEYDEAAETWRLVRYNDTAHLADVATSASATGKPT